MYNSRSKTPVNALPYYASYVTDALERQASSELFEDEHTRVQSLILLRSMLKDENHLRWQDDDTFLLAFLRAKKFDVKKAFQLIKAMYTTFGRHSNIYYNFSFERLQEIMESNTVWFLPQRDDDNCVVILFRFDTWNIYQVSVEEQLVSATIGLFDALRSPVSQIAGFKLIMDFGSFSFSHLLHMSVPDIWFFTEILQNSIPLRPKEIHVVNQNRLFSSVFAIFKQFISRKLRERIHIHGKNTEELQKFINPGILPEEYSGEQPPYDNSEWRKRIEASKDYIKHVLSFGYDKYCTKTPKKSES